MDDFFKLRAVQMTANHAAIQHSVDFIDQVCDQVCFELRDLAKFLSRMPAGNEAPPAADLSVQT